ncbi:hypothetical protein C8Q76DRAFT_797469 [Earliella scabrosa]|nr:hypothetical protein C8Q76DRAFT_797469 [Earliella scabrosa]
MSSSAIYKISVELHERIVMYMDFETMFAWRHANRFLYQLILAQYDRDLATALKRHVPDPPEFLRLMNQHDVVLVGEGALCVLLRDATIQPETLDLALGSHNHASFEAALATRGFTLTVAQGRTPTRRRLRHERIAQAPGGRGVINILIAESAGPLEAFRVAPHTAWMSFVGPTAVGCAYAALTLARRTMIEPGEPATGLLPVLRRLNLDPAFETTQWPEYNEPSHTSRSRLACPAKWFLCPRQNRTWVDPGAYLTMVDPCRQVTTIFRHHPQQRWPADEWKWDGELRRCVGRCHPEDGFHGSATITIGGKAPMVRRPTTSTYPSTRARRARSLTV